MLRAVAARRRGVSAEDSAASRGRGQGAGCSLLGVPAARRAQDRRASSRAAGKLLRRRMTVNARLKGKIN